MASVDILLTWVKAGSMLSLLGYIGVFLVFWKQIAAQFHYVAASKLSIAGRQNHDRRARVLIDSGDGKPVPLDEASTAAVRAALTALEKRQRPDGSTGDIPAGSNPAPRRC